MLITIFHDLSFPLSGRAPAAPPARCSSPTWCSWRTLSRSGPSEACWGGTGGSCWPTASPGLWWTSCPTLCCPARMPRWPSNGGGPTRCTTCWRTAAAWASRSDSFYVWFNVTVCFSARGVKSPTQDSCAYHMSPLNTIHPICELTEMDVIIIMHQTYYISRKYFLNSRHIAHMTFNSTTELKHYSQSCSRRRWVSWCFGHWCPSVIHIKLNVCLRINLI